MQVFEPTPNFYKNERPNMTNDVPNYCNPSFCNCHTWLHLGFSAKSCKNRMGSDKAGQLMSGRNVLSKKKFVLSKKKFNQIFFVPFFYFPLFFLQYCRTWAPSWIFSLAENLESFSLQDGATKWHLSQLT